MSLTLTPTDFVFDLPSSQKSYLRLGSFTCQCYYPDEYHQYAELLASHFRTYLKPPAAFSPDQIDLDIIFVEDKDNRFPGLRERWNTGATADSNRNSTFIPFDVGYVITTDIASGYLFSGNADQQVPRLLMPIVATTLTYDEIAAFILALLHRVLLMMNRLPLHAAAVYFENSTSVFIGDKGAGKTTTSMKLARMGGIILGEDHIMIRQQGDEIWASGLDEIARITEKTEQYLFAQALPITAQTFGGLQKKELSLGDFFNIMPYVDFKVDRLFFNHVGGRFKVQALPSAQAFLDLAARTKTIHRLQPGYREDYAHFLSYISHLVAHVPAFDLELSSNLSELHQLVDYLRRLPTV